MGKAAKEHRKKVQARNNKIKQQKTKMEKMQREFLMNLIKQEQEKGMFDNNPSLNGPIIGDGPMIDGQNLSDRFDFGSPMIDGPTIDSPMIEEETNTTTTEVVSEDKAGE